MKQTGDNIKWALSYTKGHVAIFGNSWIFFIDDYSGQFKQFDNPSDNNFEKYGHGDKYLIPLHEVSDYKTQIEVFQILD